MLSIIKNKLNDASISLIMVTFLLSVIGLISISSVTINQDISFTDTSFFRQILWMIPAVVFLFITFSLSRKNIYKYSPILYFLFIMLLFAPYLSTQVAGTHRWITFGSIHIQPSEIAKFLIVLVLARYLSNPKLRLNRKRAVLMPLIITAIPALIVLKQPDLGTAIIMASPVIVMMFWAGVKPFNLFLLIAPIMAILTAFNSLSFWIWAVLLLIILYLARPTMVMGVVVYFANIFLGLLSPTLWNMLKPYQQKRILTVLDPTLDPLGAGYQIIQSQTAIGSGGFLGKGWGQGTQTQLKYLPVQETDFIVSVIGEEFGFIAIFIILVLFGWMLLRMLKLAYESDNKFSSLAIIGIMVIFLTHIFVNVAMAAGMIPVKGLPLPFLSYGGSFLLSCYMMIGLVINLGINYSD